MKRAVYGISDWPEESGKEFLILYAKPEETDEDAKERAKSHYSPDLEVFVKYE